MPPSPALPTSASSGGCVIRARARLNLSAVVGSDRIFGQNRHFSFKTRLEGTLSSQVGRYLVGLVVATPSLFPHLMRGTPMTATTRIKL